MRRQGSNRSGQPVRKVNQERPETPIRLPDPASPGLRGRDSRKKEENPVKPENSALQDAPGAMISGGSIGKVALLPANAGMCAEQGDGCFCRRRAWSHGRGGTFRKDRKAQSVIVRSAESTRGLPALRARGPDQRLAVRPGAVSVSGAEPRRCGRKIEGRRWPGHLETGRVVFVMASDGQFPGSGIKWVGVKKKPGSREARSRPGRAGRRRRHPGRRGGAVAFLSQRCVLLFDLGQRLQQRR